MADLNKEINRNKRIFYTILAALGLITMIAGIIVLVYYYRGWINKKENKELYLKAGWASAVIGFLFAALFLILIIRLQ